MSKSRISHIPGYGLLKKTANTIKKPTKMTPVKASPVLPIFVSVIELGIINSLISIILTV